MIIKQGLDELVPDQKEKQHSFQEIPLLNNGTSFNLSSQVPIYWDEDPERSRMGQGGKF